MDLIEIEEKQTVSREEAARLLHQIADSLARHNQVEFQRNGKSLHVKVADQVELEIEIEIETDKSSLEIELNW